MPLRGGYPVQCTTCSTSYSRLGGHARLLACTGQATKPSGFALGPTLHAPLALRGRAECFFSTHNRDAKLAEMPKTAARISQLLAGCPEVRFRKISPRVAPVCDRKFFFSPPCLCAVFGIGYVCIAVLNGSGSLELRRRRVKSANKRYGYAEVHLVDSAIAAVDCLVMGSP